MPQMLKPAVAKALCELLEPIQQGFKNSQEWRDIEMKAYPPPEVKKKVKKEKNLGTGFPGAKKDVVAKPDGHVEGKAQDAVKLAKGAQDALSKFDLNENGGT